MHRFHLEEILEERQLSHKPTDCRPDEDAGLVSLHDIGVVEALMLERLLEASLAARPPARSETIIVGIEPARVEPSMELSPALETKLPLLLQTVVGELAQTPSLFREPPVRAYEEESL